MSQRRAKRCRYFTRAMNAKRPESGMRKVLATVILETFTPRERRRAEAVVAHKPPGTKRSVRDDQPVLGVEVKP